MRPLEEHIAVLGCFLMSLHIQSISLQDNSTLTKPKAAMMFAVEYFTRKLTVILFYKEKGTKSCGKGRKKKLLKMQNTVVHFRNYLEMKHLRSAVNA